MRSYIKRGITGPEWTFGNIRSFWDSSVWKTNSSLYWIKARSVGVSQRVIPDDRGIDTHTGRRDTDLQMTHFDVGVTVAYLHMRKKDAPPPIKCT